jgi:hypothetical protein
MELPIQLHDNNKRMHDPAGHKISRSVGQLIRDDKGSIGIDRAPFELNRIQDGT